MLTSLEDDMNQTGVDLGVSALVHLTKDPKDMETDKLDRRLAMYAQAGSNAGLNNNRAEIEVQLMNKTRKRMQTFLTLSVNDCTRIWQLYLVVLRTITR